MKMLDIDIKDVKDLTKLTRNEAYEFLRDGVPIVCRVSSREFQKVFKEQELDALVRLEACGIYNALEFYL